MNFYENLVILNPNLDDKVIDDAVERVKNMIIQKGGEILKLENWGRKKLAYELKKHNKGVYIFLLFKASPPVITELERHYNVFDFFLKSLFIKLKKKQVEALLSSISDADSKKVGSSTPEER